MGTGSGPQLHPPSWQLRVAKRGSLGGAPRPAAAVNRDILEVLRDPSTARHPSPGDFTTLTAEYLLGAELLGRITTVCLNLPIRPVTDSPAADIFRLRGRGFLLHTA